MAMTDTETPSESTVPSYHDLHITTAEIERTSIFDLPYNIEVHCSRVTGWQVWDTSRGMSEAVLLAGEYDDPDKWLVLDVSGNVIVDSRGRPRDD